MTSTAHGAITIPAFAGQPDLGCRDARPEIFFPAIRGHDAADDAKRLCRRCPYRWDCLEFALATDQRHGIWGGATPEERRRILTGRGLTTPRRPPGRPALVQAEERA